MKLEVEYDQLKHQLAPQTQRNPALTGYYYSSYVYHTCRVFCVDRTAVVNYTSPTAKPPLPPSQDSVGFDQTKNRLIERKQQQWKQENGNSFFENIMTNTDTFSLIITAEKQPVWNPFGRPGAGASNFTEQPVGSF